MKESYGEGLASHTGPEPCVGLRKQLGEALDRGKCRPSIEPRKQSSTGAPTPFPRAEGNITRFATGKSRVGSTWSETSCMHGNTSRENRELLSLAQWHAGSVSGSLRAQAENVRRQEV